MIEKPATFRSLIDHLGGVNAFASAVSIPDNTAKGMRLRNSIGVKHWEAVLAAARAHGLILTTDDLLNMRSRREAA